MSPRQATIYLLWYGEKAIAGDSPTDAEFERFKEARQALMSMSHRLMRITPNDYAYTPGETLA